MGFFSRLLEPWSKKTAGRNVLDPRYFAQSGTNSAGINSTQDFIEAVYKLSYIGFASGKRGSAIAKTGWQIVDAKGKEVVGTKSAAILARPENSTSFFQWSKTIGEHLFLDGNCFIVKGLGNALDVSTGKPSQLLIINPALVEVMDESGLAIRATTSNCGRKIAWYNVFLDGTYRHVPIESMIHINAGNSINMLRGMGCIQKNANLLEGDKMQEIFNKAFFEGGAVANLILEQLPDSSILPTDAKIMVEEFRRLYGQKKQPIMIAPDGYVVKPLNIDYKAMQFAELKTMTKEDIMMFSGIPRSMWGAQNQYVSKTEDKIAWEEVIEDDFVVIEQELTTFVQEIEGSVDRFFQFKRSNTVDIDNALKVIASGIPNAYVRPREARLIVGLADDPTAYDDYLIPMNYMPIDDFGVPLPTEPAAKSVCCELGEKSIDDADQKRSFQNRIMRAAKKTKKKLETKAEPFVKDYYKGLIDRIIGKKSAQDFDWDSEEENTMKHAKRMFTSLVAVGMESTNDLYGTELKTDFSNIKLVVDKLSKRYVSYTLQSRKDELKTIIDDTLNAGGGTGEINAKIKETFGDDFTGENAYKSRRIARTEAGNALDSANIAGFKELGATVVDVVGCEDEKTDCNRKGVPIEEADGLEFHPNHSGVIVPRIERS